MSEEQGQFFSTEDDQQAPIDLDEFARDVAAAADSAHAERERRQAEKADDAEEEVVQRVPGWANVDSERHRRAIIDIAKKQLSDAEARHQAELRQRGHGTQEHP